MTDDQLLTKEIAEQFLTNELSVNLCKFIAIEDATAEALAKHNGDLYLRGLAMLSDEAAEALGKHGGNLYLDSLATLSDEAAEAFAKH